MMVKFDFIHLFTENHPAVQKDGWGGGPPTFSVDLKGILSCEKLSGKDFLLLHQEEFEVFNVAMNCVNA